MSSSSSDSSSEENNIFRQAQFETMIDILDNCDNGKSLGLGETFFNLQTNLWYLENVLPSFKEDKPKARRTKSTRKTRAAEIKKEKIALEEKVDAFEKIFAPWTAGEDESQGKQDGDVTPEEFALGSLFDKKNFPLAYTLEGEQEQIKTLKAKNEGMDRAINALREELLKINAARNAKSPPPKDIKPQSKD